MSKTAEIKVLVEPELKTEVNKVRGDIPMSAWVRDAIKMKLRSLRATQFKEDSQIYVRDLDGTGSMHICSKDDLGAVPCRLI